MAGTLPSKMPERKLYQFITIWEISIIEPKKQQHYFQPYYKTAGVLAGLRNKKSQQFC